MTTIRRMLKGGVKCVERSARSAPSRGASLLRPARALRTVAVIVAVIGLVATAWFLFPRDVPSFESVRAQWTPSDAYLLDRHGEVIDQERMDFRVRRFEWTPLDAVSPALTAAIVDGEDRRFWQHSGVDWAALLGALRDNGVTQHRRGASTISMQVAALLDPNTRAGDTSGAWRRKIAQIRMARALDARWTKREILETYLNLLGYRGELQGIGAASQVLAGKAPSGLSLSESLVLAALLPAPRASADRVVTRACARATARHLTPYEQPLVMTRRVAKGEWMWEGVERPAISAKPSRSALTDPPPSQVFSEPNLEGTSRRPTYRTASPAKSERPLPYPLAAPNEAIPAAPNETIVAVPNEAMLATPTEGCASIRDTASAMLNTAAASTARQSVAVRLAPHLARTLLSKPGERVRTTLDAQIQRLAVDTLHQHLAGLASRNVRDGAVLVVDNDSGDVLAYVGSAGPQSRAREVDGVRARRQAGSTLKPFLYELALERQYLTAASLLNDAPITLDTASGIYLPQDYDRDFKGLVSVRTALGSSLNVPAVRALMLVGVEPFRDRLYSLGYAGITEPGEFYGYSLALGSAEVSLWEQVQAYRALARGGRLTPIRTQTRATPNEVSLLAPDAAFIVADMISDRAARVVTFGLDNYLNTPFWSAVKTGTSKDMRDNWCVGFSRRFTVGVWVGNFEGDSMHDVSGVTGAAPVWRSVMMGLHAKVPSAAPVMPPGVTAVRTRFSPSVEGERTELFLKGAESAVSRESHGRALARAYENASSMKVIQVAGEIARISSPANGMVIAIDPDIPIRMQRVPLTARGADERMVLKLNGQLVGPASDNVMWAPERGSYVLALEDASGHTLDSARFIVR